MRRRLARQLVLVVLVGIWLVLPVDAVAAADWGAPLPEPLEVTRAFDPPTDPYGSGHRGVDIAGSPGQQVRAAGAGTVVYAGPLAGRGVISIEHVGGLRTTYEPVSASVTAGMTVTLGQVIGTLDPGHPGCPAAACLHWGLKHGQVYLNPLLLLSQGPVRLLPRYSSTQSAALLEPALGRADGRLGVTVLALLPMVRESGRSRGWWPSRFRRADALGGRPP